MPDDHKSTLMQTFAVAARVFGAGWLTSGHQSGMMTPVQNNSVPLLTRSSLPPLRAVRIAHGLSLRETARRARIDPAHLSRAERGERQLSVDALWRLADVLGLCELARLLAPYREAS
jgi:hypothetical protein